MTTNPELSQCELGALLYASHSGVLPQLPDELNFTEAIDPTLNEGVELAYTEEGIRARAEEVAKVTGYYPGRTEQMMSGAARMLLDRLDGVYMPTVPHTALPGIQPAVQFERSRQIDAETN